MLRFKKFYSNLLEASDAKRELLAKKYPKADVSHWEKHVPDKHLEFAARQHHLGNIRPEDHPRVNQVLQTHDSIKHPEYKKDLGSYKHISHVEDAQEKVTGKKVMTNKASTLLNHPEATLVHNNNGLTVHKLNTPEAAADFSKGTKWCTSNKGTFNHYNKQGPIHVIHTPDGKKYQVHHETDQLMDEKDVPVKPHELTKEHPEIHNVKALTNSEHKLSYELSSKEQQKKIDSEPVHKDSPEWKQQKHVYKGSKEAGELINSKHGNIKRQIASRYVEHAGKLVNDPDKYVRGVIATHPEHAGKLVNDPDPFVRSSVILKHRDSAIAGKMINDKDIGIRRAVATYSEHAGKMIKDKSKRVRGAAAWHPEHAGKLINDKAHEVRTEVAKHSEHAGKLVNDPHPNVRQQVANHKEHAHHLINDTDEHVRNTARDTLRNND